MQVARILAPIVLTVFLAHGHREAAAQTISRCVDSAGHITYTDEACPGTKAHPATRPAAAREVAQAPTERELYDRAVRDIEQRYPVLNVDSPSFDKALTDRVLQRKDYYVRAGYGTDYALRASVVDIMTPPAARGSILPPPDSYFQNTPQPSAPRRSTEDAVFEGAAKGAIYGILGLIGAAIWWLARHSKRLVRRAAYAAGSVSAIDVARKAGAASAVVERKASGALDAFKEGRRASKARERGSE